MSGIGRVSILDCSIIVAACLLAYCRTLSVPFLFDDGTSITDNASIRHLFTSLSPPPSSTVNGRPVLNFSLAINYAFGGTQVGGYHVVNLAIHILSGLTLFGILRRTLATTKIPNARAIALSAALLWVVHPLLTESVTYIIQRAESLMGLFYLLAIYCFIRGAEASGTNKRLWFVVSIAACLLGTGTKEVIVSLPIIVLLYDRNYLAGSFKEAWKLRKWAYVGLAATWAPLAASVILSNGRSGSVGFARGASALDYLITQFPAVVHYLWLCVWPRNLIFDYGTGLEAHSLRIIPEVLLVAGLVAATAWGLFRRTTCGFLGAVFFATLAPSSSILPIVTETMAEQRMYLASIPVVVLLVLGIYRALGRFGVAFCAGLAVLLLGATIGRNETYRSSETLWRDTARKLPQNERAHYNLGCILEEQPGGLAEAISQFEQATSLRPSYYKAQESLGLALLHSGRAGDAARELTRAVDLDDDSAEAHNNLGEAFRESGDLQSARTQGELALRIRPDFVEAHNNLGCTLAQIQGGQGQAMAQFREALRLDPSFYKARFNLATSLNSVGRTSEAIEQYEQALLLRPSDATIRFYLAGALLKTPGRVDEGISQLHEVLRIQPDFTKAQIILDKIAEAREKN